MGTCLLRNSCVLEFDALDQLNGNDQWMNGRFFLTHF